MLSKKAVFLISLSILAALICSCRSRSNPQIINKPFEEVQQNLQELSKRKLFWKIGQYEPKKQVLKVYYEEKFTVSQGERFVTASIKGSVFFRPRKDKTRMDVFLKSFTPSFRNSDVIIKREKEREKELLLGLQSFFENEAVKAKNRQLKFTGRVSNRDVNETVLSSRYVLFDLDMPEGQGSGQFILIFGENVKMPEAGSRLIEINGQLSEHSKYEENPAAYVADKAYFYVKSWRFVQ